jgi:hypothetical protein
VIFYNETWYGQSPAKVLAPPSELIATTDVSVSEIALNLLFRQHGGDILSLRRLSRRMGTSSGVSSVEVRARSSATAKIGGER